MANNAFKKAVRQGIWAKVALMGASGSGKTYSALKMATGMKEELAGMGVETGIAFINTESSRGLYYSNEFDYDILHAESPHNPEKYVDLIQDAVDAGYKILVIDSTSHEWEGKGGCLELQQAAGGTYQAWAKVTPRHNRFIEAIADSPIHIIATMRGKDQYAMETSATGKLTVKKMGVGSKQREGFEYEFSCTFLLDQNGNMAEAQKDNTHIFENEGLVLLSESHGKKVIKWANSGEAEYVPVQRHGETPAEEIAKLKGEAIELAKFLGGQKNQSLMDEIEKYTKSGNPNKIKDVEDLRSLVSTLNLMKTEKEQE